MAKVTNMQGDKNATAEGMVRYQFSGLAPDQYEHVPDIGETYVMTVSVTCTGHMDKQTANEGIRRSVNLKVINATLGKLIPTPEEEPQLPYDEDGYGDYADEPETPAPDNVVSPFSDAR